MQGVIGVRRETKSPWDRRSPITPQLTRKLVNESGLEIIVQPSARRVFPDKEYVRAGASLNSDLSNANIILGVKEIPPDLLAPNATYMFFSHVIKAQPYNMPMLRRILELGCTLLDYELVTDDQGRRLIAFGRFAGLAGMIDSLSALGQRLTAEGIRSPFSTLKCAHEYESLSDAKAAIQAAGRRVARDGLPTALVPLVIGIAGYGNVASGVREILSELPTREVTPDRLPELSTETGGHCIYQTTLREEHLVASTHLSRPFVLQDYYDNPGSYHSIFAHHLPLLTVLMNCNYWDDRYPRLVTKSELRALYDSPAKPRLRVIGDIGCDIGGAVECTLKTTDPGNPVYVWDAERDLASPGVDGKGPVVLAVDILPAELPTEASEGFSSALQTFLPALAKADFTASFDTLRLPPEIHRSVIVHRGDLTEEYSYLDAHLEA